MEYSKPSGRKNRQRDLIMDNGVVDLVNYFNSIELKTRMSCEGHYPEQINMSLFWISFDKSVSQKDIEDFMKTKCDEYGSYLGHGWFVQRLIPNYGSEWRYVAANKEIANIDYKIFKSMRPGG